MKRNRILALLAAAILVAGILIAGCTQDGSSGSVPNANSQHYSTSGGDERPSATDGARNSNFNGTRQFSGQNFLSNETLLADAAGKLGVSEQDMKNALDSTRNATSGRPDLSAAARKIGVTPQQLSDALGIHASSRVRSGGNNATQSPRQ